MGPFLVKTRQDDWRTWSWVGPPLLQIVALSHKRAEGLVERIAVMQYGGTCHAGDRERCSEMKTVI